LSKKDSNKKKFCFFQNSFQQGLVEKNFGTSLPFFDFFQRKKSKKDTT
jgi:hypothetical protein